MAAAESQLKLCLGRWDGCRLVTPLMVPLLKPERRRALIPCSSICQRSREFMAKGFPFLSRHNAVSAESGTEERRDGEMLNCQTDICNVALAPQHKTSNAMQSDGRMLLCPSSSSSLAAAAAALSTPHIVHHRCLPIRQNCVAEGLSPRSHHSWNLRNRRSPCHYHFSKNSTVYLVILILYYPWYLNLVP